VSEAPDNSVVHAYEPGANPHRAASLAVLLGATFLHLFLVFRFPLAPDEAYYWQWSRHLALGYYDQGPMVAWWIRASCFLFGETELGVRFGIVVASTLTIWLVYLTARDLFSPRVAFLSLFPSVLTPLSLAGGFIATYDPLVVLFWAAGLYCASRAVFFHSRPAWISVGVAFGLGLLAKHTMAVFAPALLLFLAGAPRFRGLLRRPEPWAALIVAILMFSPNLWWQANHEWMTFRHLFLLTGKGLDQPFGRRLGDFVGSQAGLITPVLFVLCIVAVCWTGARGRHEGGERHWFLFCFSGPILALFVLMTVKSKVQANWAVCGWLTPPIAVALWVDEGITLRNRTTRRKWYHLSLAMASVLSALLLFPEVRALLRIPIPAGWDQMNKLYGGDELADAANPVKREMENKTGGRIAVGAVTYDNASRMAFYMEGQPDTCCLFAGTRLNSYVLWNHRTLPQPGGSMLLADDYPPDEPRLAPFRQLFDRVESEGKAILVHRPGVYSEPVHAFYLYRCYGYRPNPAIETPSGG
jgi:4-amino-4-deoxy-L-arabinose transferase-like glycosyltransferase